MVPTPVRSRCSTPFVKMDRSRSWYCFMRMLTRHYRLCFLGFGNVGRALARLLVAKSVELRERYGIEWEITGVATRRMGWRASGEAIDIATTDQIPQRAGLNEWLATARPDVLFETTSLNPETGQPAI